MACLTKKNIQKYIGYYIKCLFKSFKLIISIFEGIEMNVVSNAIDFILFIDKECLHLCLPIIVHWMHLIK